MKKSTHTCDLKSCFLCCRCLPEWKQAIQVHKRNSHFKKGSHIFQEGDPVKGIYFVYNGSVKVHKKWGKDKELIIRFARQGDIFGHRGLGRETHYPVSATAMEPLDTCFIDLHFFEASLKTNQVFMYELLHFFADELQESERKMRDLAHLQVKGRVSKAFLDLREKFGLDAEGALRMVLSRQDLASLVGAAYETVFRIINELAEECVIRLDGKNIFLLDQARLASYTSE